MVSHEMGHKMKNFPVFTSRYSVGCTFVSWSYHWLAGHTHYWHAGQGWIELPHNPNTGINAHGFKKNYCAGSQEWLDFINDDRNNIPQCSMYGGVGKLGVRLESLEGHADYSKAFALASGKVPLIFFQESPVDPWYFLYARSVPEFLTASKKTLSQQEIENFQHQTLSTFLSRYFNDALTKFGSHIWDLRELVAINFKYLKIDGSYIDQIDRSLPHLFVDSRDLWYNGEDCMRRIFSYLSQPLIESQLNHWRQVYLQWQAIQLKALQFNWYLPTIVDAVVNNHDFDLDFLNLSLKQEAVIQGILMDTHNFGLRCYGLEKFPSNTRQLHVLLEDNLHHD